MEDSKITCCGGSPCDGKIKYVKLPTVGHLNTPIGTVPIIPSALSTMDRLGAWKVRWKIARMNYQIEPGLYAVGRPSEASPVLVTANYKLSFDHLRKELIGIDAWILVLDTKGINVWCAAGKGTFSTRELVLRIKVTNLEKVVGHRTIILPQLGAPGVAAHEVKKHTGFHVVYGPIKAADIPVFLSTGYKATPAMRRVTFSLKDRLILVPVELMGTLAPSLIILGIILMGSALTAAITLSQNVWIKGITYSAAYLGAVLIGAAFTPILLPLIPGRSFAFKGWLLGLIWIFLFLQIAGAAGVQFANLEIWGLFLLLPAISSFLSLNFTGCTTFTSQSG
ncbi:MAG: mercury methylation corrinoid protein HgcA [Bacillota bacterium]